MGKYLKLHKKLLKPVIDAWDFKFLCYHIDFTEGDANLLAPDGFNDDMIWRKYWAVGVEDPTLDQEGLYYSPLRQNIVLLLACLNNEM